MMTNFTITKTVCGEGALAKGGLTAVCQLPPDHDGDHQWGWETGDVFGWNPGTVRA